jgi:hypothetical protein
MAVRPRIKFVPGKTYTYSGAEGVYSVIAGEVLEGDGVPTGGNLVFGEGAPSSGTGKTNDVYIDTTNFKLHTRGAGGWDVGAAFKGTNGTNGTNGAAGINGKSVRFGNGAPSSGLGDNDDVYFDLTDFKLHTKSAGAWGSGTVFKGSNGSNGAAGVNGKGIKWGNGAPVGSPGDDDDLYFDLDNLQVYPKVSGAWSNAGKKGFRGTDGSNGINGTKVLQGVSAPGASDGDDGDTFIDATNHKIYKKTAGSWAEQGSGFKGSKGDNGSNGTNGKRGKTTLEGDGPPGTGSNFATATAALTAALTAESMTAADLEVGDLYLDTTNHKFYRKISSGWKDRSSFRGTDGANGINGTKVLQGSSAPGAGDGDDGDTFIDATNHKLYKKTAGSWAEQGSGFKGSTGADGAGVSKYSSGLGADTYLSADTTASSATTLGNLGYPTVLALSDVMDDVGGVVTRSSHTFQRRALTNSAGSKFTINTAGRYKVDYFATFNIDPVSASASRVEITAFIDYSTDDGANFTTLISQTATVSTESSTAIQTTMELTKTAFFPAGTSLYFKAKRGASANSVMMIITANAITKSEIGEDTFIVITKL